MKNSSRFIVALHILAALETRERLAEKTGQDPLARSDELAYSVNTNPVVIRRILGKLQEAGLVTSRAGRNGGTLLARPASGITLREVYEAVEEDDLFHLHYSEPNKSCPVGCFIQDAVYDVFDEAHLALKNVLSGKTIADVTQNIMHLADLPSLAEPGMSMEQVQTRFLETSS